MGDKKFEQEIKQVKAPPIVDCETKKWYMDIVIINGKRKDVKSRLLIRK